MPEPLDYASPKPRRRRPWVTAVALALIATVALYLWSRTDPYPSATGVIIVSDIKGSL
jgi:uncharacterized protein involved in exopolysaccharide biosynthesis